MRTSNLNYLISKRYIAYFIKLLKASKQFDDLTILKMHKQVLKYEDLSYLSTLFNDENKGKIIQLIKVNKFSYFEKTKENVKKDINLFFETYFEGKEILDIKGIKAQLKKLDTGLKALIYPLHLHDVTPLCTFKSAIDVELDVYMAKRKTDEYIEMSRIRNSILNIIKNTAKAVDDIVDDTLIISDEEYYELLIKKIHENYQTIIDNKNNKTGSIPEWGKGLLFALPWIIGFLVFTLYPLITTFIFSFSSVELKPSGFETELIGFTNYINIFTKDTDFIYAISDYIVEIIIYVPLITIFSLMIALLLNTKVKGTGFFRTIFFLPVIITSGPVMKILIEQGVTSIPGLAEMINLEEISAKLPHFVNTALDVLTNEFIMILWFCGIQILVFITGLQKIDKGVYEAANIDGASRWERFWKVTIPALNPTIVINVVFTIVMQSLFALNPIIIKIQNDMNDSSGIKGYGYSSAIAFTYFIVMILLLVIFVLIFKRKDKKVRKERN